MAEPAIDNPPSNPPGEDAAASATAPPAAAAVPSAADAASGAKAPAAGPTPPDVDLTHLNMHTRSLLKVRVPVTVTLATQRTTVQEILELGPGSLVKFEKTYDRPLELAVGELPVAQGEAVKVGDKFGLRIGRLIRAQERFASVDR
jgi:flagellar motor switch/type III secretory pathway protein FliN